MTKDIFSWRIGGQAGEGIDSAGEVFGYSMAQAGLHIHTYREFPSRIRGGHTSYEIRMGSRPIRARASSIDYLVALDQETVDRHISELSEPGVVIYDSSSFEAKLPQDKEIIAYPVPILKIAEDLGLALMKNMVSLGVTAYLLGFETEVVLVGVKKRWGRKGEKVVNANRGAIEAGYEYANRNIEKVDDHRVEIGEGESKLFVTGNDVLALGALAAGCRFFSGYPITPATEFLEFMAKNLPKLGGVFVQAEDEISAVNLAVGASYAGVRAMTATSGPGLSLMTETISLAGMTETPLVLLDVQRSGPSTGLPTKHEQSDLGHVVYGSHGDFPRIVLSPSGLEECFTVMADAFNLAEKHQCPVIVLSDLTLSMGKLSVETTAFDFEKVEIDRGSVLTPSELDQLNRGNVLFKRYQITDSGISSRSLPGLRFGVYTANGNEHDEVGYTTENMQNRISMMDKRLRKLNVVWNGRKVVDVEGSKKAENGLTGIGSTRGVALEAIEMLSEEGIECRYISLKALKPFPSDSFGKALRGVRRLFVVESNATGQLAQILRANMDELPTMVSILRYDGRPFKPVQIYESVKGVAE